MKRWFLLIATNIAVVAVIGVLAHVLGLNRFISNGSMNAGMLLMYCALFGFAGSFISLWMSKWMAKMSTGAKVITGSEGAQERWLVETVSRLSAKAGIQMPEVAIYEGEPNAFATGASRNSALVAVSTGLMRGMNKEQVEAVLAHEVAHAANGDMVTMTLVQGVVNTFVMFLARIIGFAVDQFLKRDEEDAQAGQGWGYMLTVLVLDIVLGILASVVVAYVSRHREYRADAGAAALMGTAQPMMDALKRLNQLAGNESEQAAHGALPDEVKAFGIKAGRSKGLGSWFNSHPPIEDRIEALRNWKA